MDKIVCKKAGKYQVLIQNGYSNPFMTIGGQEVTSQKYIYADFTTLEGEKYYSEPCKHEITFDNLTYSYVVHKDAGIDSWSMEDYYFTKEDYEEIFRTFIPRYLQTKLFSEVEQMNEWLKNTPKDAVRDIKPMVNPDALCWLVLYEERGDE